MSRRWLVVVSIAAHLAIMVGLVVSGIWRIERVESGRARTTLDWHPPPPPAPSGGPVAAVADPNRPKRPPIAKGLHQPKKPPDVTPTEGPVGPQGPGPGSEGPPDSPCVENCGEGPVAAPVCGNGSLEVGEQCDDGNTADGDGCSATCRTEPKPPAPEPVTHTLAPTVMQGLRVSGETQVHPSAVTQNQMMRDGVSRADGVLLVCIAVDGRIASARVVKSTKYSDYDAALLSAVRGWHYRPYTFNGTAVPACSTVRFVYTIN